MFSELPAKMRATASASAPTPFSHGLGGLFSRAILIVQCASISVSF
ncbi:MAG: hypothetical protein J6K14_08065 [Clostridia bacterium]|nr:hypothetical protein [Clostridia bacterium]